MQVLITWAITCCLPRCTITGSWSLGSRTRNQIHTLCCGTRASSLLGSCILPANLLKYFSFKIAFWGTTCPAHVTWFLVVHYSCYWGLCFQEWFLLLVQASTHPHTVYPSWKGRAGSCLRSSGKGGYETQPAGGGGGFPPPPANAPPLTPEMLSGLGEQPRHLDAGK